MIDKKKKFCPWIRTAGRIKRGHMACGSQSRERIFKLGMKEPRLEGGASLVAQGTNLQGGVEGRAAGRGPSWKVRSIQQRYPPTRRKGTSGGLLKDQAREKYPVTAQNRGFEKKAAGPMRGGSRSRIPVLCRELDVPGEGSSQPLALKEQESKESLDRSPEGLLTHRQGPSGKYGRGRLTCRQNLGENRLAVGGREEKWERGKGNRPNGE